MSDSQRVVLDAAIDGLRRHAPFDRMEAEALAYLAGQMRIAYFARDRVIAGPSDGAAATLYIVQRGLVRGNVPEDSGLPDDPVEILPGECFPLGAVVARQPPKRRYLSGGDTFCYEIDGSVVETLARMSPAFQAFCNERVGALLAQSYRQLRASAAADAPAEQSLAVPLARLLRRAPLSCAPGRPLREALAEMRREKVGSIAVVDPAGAPIGIFTERDLLARTVDGTLDLASPVSNAMTSPVIALPSVATAAEAALEMVRAGVRHLGVTESGRLIGVISERDLFALQRTSLANVMGGIDRADDAAALSQAAADIRALATNLVAQGLGVEPLTQLVASMNDRLVVRAIRIESLRHDIGDLDWCWMALGSEGRMEQTLATDQDNGIVIGASGAGLASARARLLPFAQDVNRLLDACGFPLCRGEIMAGNPKWCLSIDEWRDRFASWMGDPLPQALLNASIFFDFRPLAGREALAAELRDGLVRSARGNDRFLRAFAQSALESRPPLSMFGRIATSGTGSSAHTIDLKAQGTRAFVDAARIFALASGCAGTRTAERLRCAAPVLGIPAAEVEAIVEAFHFLLLFRVRRQQAADGGDPNRIDPDQLNELDRRILKECFRQVRTLQTRLALDYRL